MISPLEGEMSPKATEGVGSTGLSLLTTERGWRFTRGDPLWPAGHLPHKGSLKGEITRLRLLPSRSQ